MNITEQIKEALTKASPGPWFKEGDGVCDKNNDVVVLEATCPNNIHLIANAPEWLTHQQSIISQQTEELRLLKFQLEVFTNANDVEYETRYQLEEANQKVSQQTAEIAALTNDRNECLRKAGENGKFYMDALAEIERLTQGLQWYGNKENYDLSVPVNNYTSYTSPVQFDKGKSAKKILEGSKPNVNP